jgi:hypothetical protein
MKSVLRKSSGLKLPLINGFAAWLLLPLLLWPVVGQAQFTLSTNAGAITITGYAGPGGTVTIPSTTNGLPVVAIGANALQRQSNLTDVIIPDSITNIGQYAFYGCTNLINATIGTNATSIAPFAFYYCLNLKAINVAPRNPFYSTVNGVLFDKNQTLLIQYPIGLSGSYTVPASVTNIGDYAFDYSPGLTGIILTNGLTSIGMYVFDNCISLTSVSIPASVTTIGDYAFDYCPFTRITLTNGLNGIGQGVFAECTNLTSLVIPGTVTNIGMSLCYGCTALTTAAIAGNGSSIGDDAFSDCATLASVTISNGVTQVGQSVFFYCTNLTSLTIPGSVTNIGQDAFEDCFELTSLTLPGCSVGNQAFFGCSRLGSVTITGTGGSIGNSEFANLTGLTNLVINNGIGSIGQDAFENTGLTSVTIPGSVTNLAREAFGDCGALVSLTISNGVTSIGDFAFDNSSLASATIPASVASIGLAPFYGCANLTAITVDAGSLFYSSSNGVLFDKNKTTVIESPAALGGSFTIPASVASIADYAFDDCAGLTGVTVPAGVTNIGQYAFAGTGLFNVVIPGAVTKIGDFAFDGCSSLVGVFFRGNPPVASTNVFMFDNLTTVYYLPGHSGWSSPFAGRPAILWNPLIQTGGGSPGVANQQFGFNITGTTNIPFAVEACTNLAHPIWSPLQTFTLTNGSVAFRDPQWTNFPGRFYRLSSP